MTKTNTRCANAYEHATPRETKHPPKSTLDRLSVRRIHPHLPFVNQIKIVRFSRTVTPRRMKLSDTRLGKYPECPRMSTTRMYIKREDFLLEFFA